MTATFTLTSTTATSRRTAAPAGGRATHAAASDRRRELHAVQAARVRASLLRLPH